ncbi:MAG: hypothetical protein E6Q85_03935 [Thiothrix sp.]|nr:MAG: hypothetical protein E6Q85_03935 [Thiothrix sp.]
MRLTVQAAIRQLHADLEAGISSVNSNRQRLIDLNSLACVLEATKTLITDRVKAYWRGEQERILATEEVANIEDSIANYAVNKGWVYWVISYGIPVATLVEQSGVPHSSLLNILGTAAGIGSDANHLFKGASRDYDLHLEALRRKEKSAEGGRHRSKEQQKNYDVHKEWWDKWQQDPSLYRSLTEYDEAMRDKTGASVATVRRHRGSFLVLLTSDL